jgi:hypothetical protein
MVDDCCDFGDDSCAPPALRLPEPTSLGTPKDFSRSRNRAKNAAD